jgi:hypothetical protein
MCGSFPTGWVGGAASEQIGISKVNKRASRIAASLTSTAHRKHLLHFSRRSGHNLSKRGEVT